MPAIKTVDGRIHQYNDDKQFVMHRNNGVVEIQVVDNDGNIGTRHPYQNVAWYIND